MEPGEAPKGQKRGKKTTCARGGSRTNAPRPEQEPKSQQEPKVGSRPFSSPRNPYPQFVASQIDPEQFTTLLLPQS